MKHGEERLAISGPGFRLRNHRRKRRPQLTSWTSPASAGPGRQAYGAEAAVASGVGMVQRVVPEPSPELAAELGEDYGECPNGRCDLVAEVDLNESS